MHTCSNKQYFEEKTKTGTGPKHWAYPLFFPSFFNSTWVKGYCAKPLHHLAPEIRFLWHCQSVTEN